MKEKKKNTTAIYVSIFIAFIMITSVIGYIFGDSSQQTVRYKNLKFTLTSEGWKTKYEGKPYIFTYTPKDLEGVNISESINLADLLQIDVTYDYNSTFAENIAYSIFELSKIGYERGIYIRQGFTTNASEGFPVIKCENASQFVPIVYFKSSNVTQFKQEGNCILIESSDSNGFLPLSDKLAYRMLRIV